MTKMKTKSSVHVSPTSSTDVAQRKGSELMTVTISTLKDLLDVIDIDADLLLQLQSLDTIIVKKMCAAMKEAGRKRQLHSLPVTAKRMRLVPASQPALTANDGTGSAGEIEVKHEEGQSVGVEGPDELVVESSTSKNDSGSNFIDENDAYIIHSDASDMNLRYQCSVCGYSARYTTTVQAHISTHTGRKPFKCKYCSTSFVSAYKLKQHVRSHFGIKPYECQFCDQKLSRKLALNRHLASKHGYKAYTCSLCAFAATEYMNLRSHYTKQHPGSRIKRSKLKHAKDLDQDIV